VNPPGLRQRSLLVAVLVLLVASFVAGSGGIRASAANGPALLDTSPSAATWTTEVNLLDGSTYVAPGLSYQGLYNGVNTSFPVLLTGSNDSQFWSLDQSVLDMAPQLSYVYGHDMGMILFNASAANVWSLTADAVTSEVYNGDGATLYFLMTPTSTANWTSDAFFSEVTDGPSLALCSGDLIFPYSTTPYFAVQWDPAYAEAHCGTDTVGQFNVFLVEPGAGGVVSSSSITAYGPIGSNSTYAPAVHDVFNVTATYNATSDELDAVATDRNSSTELAALALNLSSDGFAPHTESPTTSYLAVADGASDHTSWGLEYAAYLPSVASVTVPPPPPPPSSIPVPFNGSLTPEVNLLNGTTYVAPGLRYSGLYNGLNSSFPVLLTGANDSQFWSLDQSVLDMAPQLSFVYGHDMGMILFNATAAREWTVSTEAVTSLAYNGDGVTSYFLLSPTSTANDSAYAYLSEVTDGPSLAQCSGDLIFPFSTTPYFAVQWDPAYRSAHCGIGTVGEFNVFLVQPGVSGVVSADSITVLGPIGENTTYAPSVSDVFNVTASYNVTTDQLDEVATDASTSSALAQLSLNLSGLGFTPSAGASYLAVAEGASDHTSWGLEYAGYAASFAPALPTSPPPVPSPPFTGNFTSELDLNAGASYVNPEFNYESYSGGVNTSYPTLLSGSSKGAFNTSDRSVLELAPPSSPEIGPATGLVLFAARASAQWEVSADAVTTTGPAGVGAAFYFLLTPTSSENWNSQSYVDPFPFPCAGDLLLPYSLTPYFVVVWVATPGLEGCGSAAIAGEFNVLAVDPGAQGVVTAQSVVGVAESVGTRTGAIPGANDVFNVTAGYKTGENVVEARAFDQNSSSALAYAVLNLSTVHFRPPGAASVASYLGVAQGSTGAGAWGLEFVGYTTWTKGWNTTEPPSFLTPPPLAVTSPPPPGLFGWVSGAPWIMTAVEVGLVSAAVLGAVAAGAVTARRHRLRREGEELVAGMEQLISEGGAPPRSP
jgi:hypothetical protein